MAITPKIYKLDRHMIKSKFKWSNTMLISILVFFFLTFIVNLPLIQLFGCLTFDTFLTHDLLKLSQPVTWLNKLS